MLNDSFEQWYKNKNMFTSNNEWSKQASEFCNILQHTAQRNLEIINENVFRCSDQFKRLTSIKRPEEFLSLQKDIFNDNMCAAMQNIQSFMSSYAECTEECMQLFKSASNPTAAFYGSHREAKAGTKSYDKSERAKE